MANVVGEGAAGRSTRTLRAEGALGALSADPHAPDRLRRVLEQALVFAGAAFAGFYTLGEDGELLCLAEAAGLPRTMCGVRDCYSAAGRARSPRRTAGGRCGSARRTWPPSPSRGARPAASSTSPPCPCATTAAAVCSR